MRALVVEHDLYSLPGIVGERLEPHGREVVTELDGEPPSSL
jgi:hypothetical protein